MAQRPIDAKAAERCASIVGAKQTGDEPPPSHVSVTDVALSSFRKLRQVGRAGVGRRVGPAKSWRVPRGRSAATIGTSGSSRDPAEIARIEAILRSEPGLEQVDPQTLHAALTRIAPGTTLSLTDQEPQNPDPSQTKLTQ